ncbi:MAG: SRPBCC domain-containing protein [Cytophagaceae bacterium]|nr:SRPBCC domain-containing protein [Cytophagaceae bacterium]
MKTALTFDFEVDKVNNRIYINREFAANVQLVWDAWTTAELLDQWWAPRPYETQTQSMDFRNGGRWYYAMVSPEGEKHWCVADYSNIEFQKCFNHLDAFCDENQVLNNQMPRTKWASNFTANGDNTLVNLTLEYEKPEDLENIIQMGFKEGFTMAMDNLDQYIAAQFYLRKQNQKDKHSRVSTYLNFPGNTEEAFEFYKSVFKNEYSGAGIQRFGVLPTDPTQPPIAENVKNMVLHIELPIMNNHILMGTDAPKEMGFNVTIGNNMHIQLEPETREEADRIFAGLSEGGTISMPLQEMFWGAYFGSFIDKFGINWIINCRN